MSFLDLSLILSILLCSLASGFIFTYSVVVMPGFTKLNDMEFVRAFQVTDGIIQNNQPIFMFVWIGSIVSTLCMIIIALVTLGIPDSWVILASGTIYLLGVQGTTVAVHLPLNNYIQKLDVEKITSPILAEERSKFEKKSNTNECLSHVSHNVGRKTRWKEKCLHIVTRILLTMSGANTDKYPYIALLCISDHV